MPTNFEVIKSFNCKKLAKFIARMDMFCNMCAYNLKDCNNKCIDGHQAWLEQKYVKEQKEKLPRKRG